MSEVRRAPAALEVRGLDVYYGHSHALQGVDLSLDAGVFSVVGRNGMGKTTLCKAIMGLVPVSGGSIRVRGEDITRRPPAHIARLGVGYVPQGRRLWRSLSVDEHLRLAGGMRSGAWTVERIYDTFPRLAERKDHGGGQLSGGEQQMLAISRALLTNPQLLIMDEPTEGLAPVIVAQVEEMLLQLGEDGDMSVLVIEQNIGVATAISRNVAIMVNGRINRIIDSGAAVPPTASCSSACSASDCTPSSNPTSMCRLPAAKQSRSPQPARSQRPDPDLHLQPDAADALVAAGPDRPHRGRRAHALDAGRPPRRDRTAQARAGDGADLRAAGRAGRRHARHQGRRNSASSATSSPKAACARGWSTSPPAASTQPAMSRRRRSR